MFCISRSRAGCKKTASKNIISSGSYYFFKNLAHNTITIRAQLLYVRKLQIAVSQNDSRNIFFEKTMHDKGLKLGSNVQQNDRRDF